MHEFADICILMLCLSVLGERDAVQCAWSKHCTQRLGAGGHVQTHIAVERWQQQPSFVSSDRKETKEGNRSACLTIAGFRVF